MTSNTVDAPVLVLNQNYEPLNICNVRRAIVLLGRGKAEILELDHGVIHTASLIMERPSVIRLIYLIKRPLPAVKLTRREVFARDGHICQYCGLKTRELTLDHVIPKHRGGRHSWENLVSACRPCNHRKGGKTLEEAHMKLLKQPHKPKMSGYYIFHERLRTTPNAEWQKFVPAMGKSDN
jgi:5-methylcytosine-specific restriction endonuclease McrA